MGWTDGLASFAGAASQDLQQKRKNRLEIALISKRIEMEEMAKAIPSDQFQTATGALQGKPGMDLFSISDPQAQQAVLSGMKPLAGISARAQSRPPTRPIIRDANVNGKVVREVLSPFTGEVMDRRDLGVNAGRSKAYSDSIAAYESSSGHITEMKKQLNEIFTAKDMVGRASQWANLRLNEVFTQDDPQAAALATFFQSSVVPLTRALGDNRISDTDRASLREALPKESDTLATALQKLENFQSVFESVKEGAHKGYMEPLGGQTAPKESAKGGLDLNRIRQFLPKKKP